MYEYKAKVLPWIYRDTLLEEIDLGFYVKRKNGYDWLINAPEMNSQVAYRERLARSARAKAKKFCPEGAVITIQTVKEHRDRYAWSSDLQMC
ncbi:MAG: hypothetical protein RIA62_06395 [Cyclobacteriaceae bacterium]